MFGVQGNTGTTQYDGSKPALGTTNTNAAQPITASVSGNPGQRSRATYDQVINQFGVETNPRYKVRDSNGDGKTDTFCNIFLWDVTRAMGAEIPHWVDAKGNPATPGKGNWEQNANATVDWLGKFGGKHGWRQVSDKEAQTLANQGHPTAVVWKNPKGIGHVAVVRPADLTEKDIVDRGPAIAQAGASNRNNTRVKDIFGRAVVQYWTSDGKAAGNSQPIVTSPSPPKQPAPKEELTTTAGVPEVDLRKGSQGSAVKQLQGALVSLGYMTQEQVATGPGIFGVKTEAAVQKFQAEHDISPNSGIYGPKTRSALSQALKDAASVPSPGLSRGDQGQEVRELQDALVRRGYMTKEQVATGYGVFGPQTEAAVQKFQRDRGIQPASGIYGPKTYAELSKILITWGPSTVVVSTPEINPKSTTSTTSTGSTTGAKTQAEKLDALLKDSGLKGQGAHMLAMAKKYNVPVELALAMFKMEANWNTAGRAPKNNNPGNLRFADWEKEFGGVKVDGYTKFPSLPNGIEAYFCLLNRPLYRTFVTNRDWHGLIYKYAPPKDRNDTEGYIHTVTLLVTKYEAKLSS